jgi:hypothetical protein
MTVKLIATASIEIIENDPDFGRCVRVNTTWSGAKLDRPNTHSYMLRAGKAALAARLKRAIDAQAVYANPNVVKDVNGHTYVHATCRVMGKYMNADLKRLGY